MSAGSKKRSHQQLLDDFDFFMKDRLTEWPQRWKDFKAEQGALIQELMVEATKAAEDGEFRRNFNDKMRQIIFRGDTKSVLESDGFRVAEHGIEWQTKTQGRAGELCAISDAQQSPKEIRDLKWAITDSMINRTSPGPITVRIRTEPGKAVLEEILQKYPVLQCKSFDPEQDVYVLELQVIERSPNDQTDK